MKEKPKFTLALQVIVIIVIITLKMLETFRCIDKLKRKYSKWKYPDEETVFFLFSQGKMFGKHVKKQQCC